MELENKIEETSAQKPLPETAPQPGQTSEQPTQETQPIQDSSFDISVYEKEYAESGSLSDESFKALETKGIPRAVVERYIEGQETQAAQISASVYTVCGGEENTRQVVSWAAQTLSQGEKDTFNGIVASKNTDAIKLALSGLYARYKETSGTSNQGQNMIMATSSSPSIEGYESMAQMVRDVRDPRYKSDPAFRAKVERKASVTRL